MIFNFVRYMHFKCTISPRIDTGHLRKYMSDSTAASQVFCKKMSGVYFSAISHCLRFQSRRRIRCSTFAYIILCNCSLYTLYPPVRPPCIVRRYQQPKRISPTNRIRRILKQIHSAPQPNRILTNESSRDLCKIPPQNPLNSHPRHLGDFP